jgi:hypothetical protein
MTYSILGVLFLSVMNRIGVSSLDLLGSSKVTVSSSRSILSMPFDELSESIGGSGITTTKNHFLLEYNPYSILSRYLAITSFHNYIQLEYYLNIVIPTFFSLI